MICVVYTEKESTEDQGETFVFTDYETDMPDDIATKQAIEWTEELIAEKREELANDDKEIIVDKGQLNGTDRQPWWNLTVKDHNRRYGNYTRTFTWRIVDSYHI